MSGFVGLVGTDGAPVDPNCLDRLTAAMAFRGPDRTGTWVDEHVGLGHTLLRTTVGSAGEAQPCTVDGDVWIAAAARIDDRAALVRTLGQRGRPASLDATDAELILHAYGAWGDACLDHLIGDFAFALWDGRRQRLFAARDQLGVAQLFHTRVGPSLLIGNTLQGLLAHPGIDASLDEQALADVALFSIQLDDDATAYAGIRRVPPAHALVWDRNGLRVARYWTMPQPRRVTRRSRPEEHAEAFREVFDRAVEDRLRTDRVGTQLSGGMDSTSVAVTAQRSLAMAGRPFDLRAYAVEFESLLPDEEGALARQVGQHAGFPVEVLRGEDHLRAEGAVEAPSWRPPEPGAEGIGAMAELTRRTIGFARVLLTGYGGDPLLAPPALTLARAASAVRHGDAKAPLRPLAAAWRRRRGAPHLVPAWVDPRFAARMDLPDRIETFRRRARPEQVGLVDAPFWRSLFAWSDAGYHGLPLAIRFPFFDLRLLELVLSVPPVPWLVDKQLLRAAMGDRLPDAVRNRPKTIQRGDAELERNRATGPPPWEVDLLGCPAMNEYVDQNWLGTLRSRSADVQAGLWASERPPVQLAYWLSRRQPDLDGTGEPNADTRR